MLLRSGSKKNDGKQELHNHVFDQQQSCHEFASTIVLHEYPLSIVDHIGFRKFVKSLQPCFKLVSRNTIKGDILKIYELQRLKNCNILEKLGSKIAITTDMWTSSNTKKGFMAITAHYIDESWILQSQILRYVFKS